MLTITIKTIKAQCTLDKVEFDYIMKRLNQPLELADIWFHHGGGISFLAIHTDDDRVITLFGTNGITFDINGVEELTCTHTI